MRTPLLFVFLFAACGAEAPSETPMALDAGTFEPDAGRPEGELDAVTALIAARCRPCHAAGNPKGRLVLDDPAALVFALTPEGFVLVEPGAPEASFLFHKVDGSPHRLCQELGLSPRVCGGPMPPAPHPALSSDERATIHDWIASL